MNGQCSSYSTSHEDALERRLGRGRSKKPVLPVTASSSRPGSSSRSGSPNRPGSRSRRGMLSTLGMAIGYLGLVMILSVAPFVHQTIGDPQSQYLACTDFGGSR